MKTKGLLNCIVSAALSLTTGCSCFVSSHQTVSISASEPHAKVWINGAYQGEAPLEARLRRNRDFGVVVKKEGFQSSSQTVGYHLSPTGTLDIIGTCIFLIPAVGLATAGAHSLDETVLTLHLEPEKPQTPPTQ